MKPGIKLKPELERTNKINKMSLHINKHKNDIWFPTDNLETKRIFMNTWFNIKEFKSLTQTNFKENSCTLDDTNEIKYKAISVILDLTAHQKQIINEWLNLYLKMYNIALKYIKNNVTNDKNVLNFQYLRGKLKLEKQELIKSSTVKVHDIDYAIKLVCQNYKSAISNFKNGNIKHFRIRYWSINKPIKMMDLEKSNFNSKGMRSKILGNINGYYNGKLFNFADVKSDCRLQHKDGLYYLYVPTKIEKKDTNKEKNKMITIDPGIRRFGTGITENKIVKIGEGCAKTIENMLKRKDKIMENNEICKKIKKKNEKQINKKIKNMVNELHWKTINYLTENNKTILIGDMSTKSIVKKGGNLNKMTKRIALSLNFFQFRQRLKYKCDTKGVRYGKINEWMTSKMCSKCGNVKENLGGNEIYNCEKCHMKMERDINGARNIYIKAIK